MTTCEERRDAEESVLEGKRAAFECYVLPHVDVLYRVARTMTKTMHDAEDLVQETMLRAFNAIDRFDGQHPRAWLLTIMRNQAINRSRKKTPDLLRDPDVALEAIAVGDVHEEAAEVHALAAVGDEEIQRLLDELPEKFRTVAHLVDVQGMSYQEAADALGVPVGTVMSRLHRARNRLRRRLSRAGAGREPIGG